MDELLTEEQEAERARRWLRENGAFIAAGVLVGLGGLFGWQAWNDQRVETAGEASAIWVQLRSAIDGERFNEVDETLSLLETEFATTPYLDQGRLAVAGMYMTRNDTAAATEQLEELLAKGNDPYLRRLAELRLAQILIFEEKYTEALARLGPTETTRLESLWHELRGDAFFAQGDLEAARDAYQSALDSDDSGSVDRSYLQIKLDDVTGSISAGALGDTDSEAESPPAAAPAE